MSRPIGMSGEEAYVILRQYIKDTLAGAGALKGDDGKSAYQLAVDAGYTGTLEEWLAELVGEDGKSAYDLAVEQGYVGTEEQWIASLKGKDGAGAGFDFVQATPSDTWTITHSLGNQYPNVFCVDADGDVITGDIEFYSANVTIIRFSEPVSGSAHLTQSGGSGGGGTPGEGTYMRVEGPMDRGEYDALAVKDTSTMYLIRG